MYENGFLGSLERGVVNVINSSILNHPELYEEYQNL